ncbi:hypothetical protein CFC21_074809 [Triticum aestivum]|uniref:DUF4220 domain-containing protein n=3 Tax=Triticum TaxID=4564 RepID=A0A9R0XNJ9_TRITD|nr:hypothetical protein CFC21_074809 [Triticum aestivum]VAI39821.1 unnamed protein product [Triticum turgidum subsp. durum]
MGLSDATVQWWDEWKLRLLVLCSLSVQFFLNFSFWVRIWPRLRRLRVLVWMAHIGGDALAIYALATLFNRQKQQTADGGSDALELIWVPFLLIHLGGPEMSAYSLEDNELWKRHALTLVSQVAVALYIFCKWWSGQKMLLQAAVLLFVVGILKFGEKPWALKKASFNTMASKSLSTPREEGSLPPCWKWCTSDCTDFASAKMKEEDQSNLSIEDYVKEAKGLVLSTGVQSESDQKTEVVKKIPDATSYTSMMLVDLSTRYSLRLEYLRYFLTMDDKNGHDLLRLWILNTFNALYTKRASASTCFGCCSGLLLPFLVLASLVLFAKSDKDGYNEEDITVSYILFICTVVIQFAPFLCVPCTIWGALNIATWQDMVSQHNLMLFCARKKQPTTLMKRATLECLREYINKQWYTWQEPAALQIEGLIRQYIQDGWKEYISDNDPTTYRRFNNLRGQRTLLRHPQLGPQLGWSLDLPFDEIVLVWHIATDLCFHTSSQGQSGVTIQHARQISNYMIYLLFICPEMLMPGTRQDLFIIACDDIDRILTDQKDPPSIARRILLMEHGEVKGVVLPNAHKLAKELMAHPNEEQRWKVIQGVWVEMLCYSASRCRGYLHAKSLGEGGEFLTNVWFLWSLMGMEILGDKIHIQNQPLKEEGIMGAPV